MRGIRLLFAAVLSSELCGGEDVGTVVVGWRGDWQQVCDILESRLVSFSEYEIGG